MSNRQSGYSDEEQQAILAQKREKETMRDFAIRKRMPLSTLYYWKRRYEQNNDFEKPIKISKSSKKKLSELPLSKGVIIKENNPRITYIGKKIPKEGTVIEGNLESWSRVPTPVATPSSRTTYSTKEAIKNDTFDTDSGIESATSDMRFLVNTMKEAAEIVTEMTQMTQKTNERRYNMFKIKNNLANIITWLLLSIILYKLL